MIFTGVNRYNETIYNVTFSIDGTSYNVAHSEETPYRIFATTRTVYLTSLPTSLTFSAQVSCSYSTSTCGNYSISTTKEFDFTNSGSSLGRAETVSVGSTSLSHLNGGYSINIEPFYSVHAPDSTADMLSCNDEIILLELDIFRGNVNCRLKQKKTALE